MDSRKVVYRETAVIAIGQGICLLLMFAIYFLLHRLQISVVLGGLAGAMLAIGNFFAMAVVATLAADKAEKQDVNGGKKLLSASYPLRLVTLGLLLVVLGKSGYFDLLSLVLPLAFVRPILLAAEFVRKTGD